MKFFKCSILLSISVLLTSGSLSAQVVYQPQSNTNKVWNAESLFIGVAIIAKDTNVPIVITLLNANPNTYSGKLFYMLPGSIDSAVFLFHNLHNKYPLEPTRIDIGRFDNGTPIVFCYVVDDTASRIAAYRGKKLFTGQNRVGVDPYVSEKGTNIYGRKWAVAGKIDSATVEVGFSGGQGFSCRDIVFRIDGVSISKN